MKECRINEFNSRVCQKGTKGCGVEHKQYVEINPDMVEKIAEGLFNASISYHGDLKHLGWSNEYTQYRTESKNCRFHAEHVLKVIDSLGYVLENKP